MILLESQGPCLTAASKLGQKAEEDLRTGGAGQGSRSSVGVRESEREVSKNCCACRVRESSHDCQKKGRGADVVGRRVLGCLTEVFGLSEETSETM